MDRKCFLRESLGIGLGSCIGLALGGVPASAASPSSVEEDLARVTREKEFIARWLSDLLETMDAVLDEPTRVKVIEGCGRGCFRRHAFKRDIAEAGKADVDKLIEAYHSNFEAWREGDLVHIRFGAVSTKCYCPVAQTQPAKPNDLHCECTKATHQAIFETALGRPIRVEILESLRRGGKTCHFVAHLA